VRATLEAQLGSRQVGRVVYGSILGLTLVVALEDHPPSAPVMAAWLLLSAVTVALAEVYSDVVGIKTSQRHRVDRRQLAHMVEEAGAVAFGVGLPAVSSWWPRRGRCSSGPRSPWRSGAGWG
jgi:hypothetical protein